MVIYSVFSVNIRMYKCMAYRKTENTLIKFTVGLGLSLPSTSSYFLSLATPRLRWLPGVKFSAVINQYQEDGQNI